MNEVILRENETVEDLQLNGLQLIQKKTGFRFGMDSVLLADFARIGKRDRVLDIGTGTGILMLLLYGRNKGASFEGVELQPDMAEMAERTVRLNGLEEIMKVRAGDIRELARDMEPRSFDAVICNPPYSAPGRALVNPDEARAVSRHQQENTLSDFCEAAFRLLRGKGKFSLVYPATGLLELTDELRKHHLEPKHFRLVYPYVGKPANLVLVEGIRDAKPGLHPMPPLIVFTEGNHLTNELKSVYHISETDQSTFGGTKHE